MCKDTFFVLFKITKKCGIILASIFLQLIYMLQRIFLIFAMTYVNRDDPYMCVLDFVIMFLMCVIYLFGSYREIQFLFLVFPNLLGIENLISLLIIGIYTICTLLSFASFQSKMTKLKCLIYLLGKLYRRNQITYNNIRLCVTSVMLLFFLIVYNIIFLSEYKWSLLKKMVFSFSMLARELWLTSPLFQYCLWLYAFKMTFQRLTMYHVEIITKHGGGRNLYMIYSYRERIRQYFRVVHTMMNIKRLINQVYGMTVVLNVFCCFCIILFKIFTWSIITEKFIVTAFILGTSILKIGLLFWSAESTSFSVRSFYFLKLLFYIRLDALPDVGDAVLNDPQVLSHRNSKRRLKFPYYLNNSVAPYS